VRLASCYNNECVHLSLYNDQPSSDEIYHTIQKNSLLDRLKAIDSRANRKGLDALDATRNPLIRIGMERGDSGAVTKNGYGVFNLSWQAAHHPEWPEQIRGELDEIRHQIKLTHGSPLRFLIWAGMGGSAEDKHMYNALGLLKRGPRCYVLDSTDPAKLRSILDDMARRSPADMPGILRGTLVVGMAMGMTSYEPVVNLEKLTLLYQKHRIDSRPNFLYMTLPGSLLDQFASTRGYRKVELQPDGRNSTAGRHSSPLTRGSLYPLGLCGVDLNAWMQATLLAEEEIYTAWQLSAFLHLQGIAGRDKVTLILPKEWSGAAVWTKQDFEESLGKNENLGIKIVIDEKLHLSDYRAPKEPLQDRVFLVIQLKGLTAAGGAKVAMLRRLGYPVAVLTLPRGTVLARYMQFVHYVVFGIAYLRDMNFVTQPSVELYKAITNRLHASAKRAGGLEQTEEWKAMRRTPHQANWRKGVTLYYGFGTTELESRPKTAPEIYAALLRQLAGNRGVEYGELTFFGDTRYSSPGRALRKLLNRTAERLFRSRLKMPADVYEGPAMNHSYHEMIIGHGKCFSSVLISEKAESIPAIGYTADYHRAQFLATLMALAERRRPVVAIALKDLEENTLASLDEFFQQAAKHT
jgi:glucose-6-phosphate isomerase